MSKNMAFLYSSLLLGLLMGMTVGPIGADTETTPVVDSVPFVAKLPVPPTAGSENKVLSLGAPAGSLVVFVFGLEEGETPLSGCSANVAIERPSVLGTAIASPDGVASVSFVLPEATEGRRALLQVVHQGSCQVSELLSFEIS